MKKIFYLAAPFFNDEQKDLVARLESALISAGFEIISPMRSGLILVDMSPEERVEKAKLIFERNCQDVAVSHYVLAVVDGRDTGTMFEWGYACALGKPVYSYSDKNYGVNVMLQGGTRGHATGIGMLREMLSCVKEGKDTSRFAHDAKRAY